MKKIKLDRPSGWLVVLLGLGWLALAPARAATLSLVPASTEVNAPAGSAVEVAVVIDGLGFTAPDSLSVYDISLDFDPGILAVDSVVFGDPDPANGMQLALGGAGSFTDSISGPGTLNILELSFATPFVLDTQQIASFTLATITFVTTGFGSTSLDFSNVVLGDALGDPLSATLITTNITSVPLPGALWLLVSGLAALTAVRRKRVT